eukprot:1329144-Rhodomonas_salina.1
MHHKQADFSTSIVPEELLQKEDDDSSHGGPSSRYRTARKGESAVRDWLRADFTQIQTKRKVRHFRSIGMSFSKMTSPLSPSSSSLSLSPFLCLVRSILNQRGGCHRHVGLRVDYSKREAQGEQPAGHTALPPRGCFRAQTAVVRTGDSELERVSSSAYSRKKRRKRSGDAAPISRIELGSLCVAVCGPRVWV